MKDNLQYKILKYLSENDNGDFIDVYSVESDKKIIHSELRTLNKKMFIDIRKISNGTITTKILAKINIVGIAFLKKLNSENITNNFNGATIGIVNHESNFSNSPITNNTTQNPKSELKTNSITLKFWKLISENKLISSLILAVILFAIKRIFNIEL